MLCHVVGRSYSIRPSIIYDTWDFNELISCWIQIEEENYQQFRQKQDPKTLFIESSNSVETDIEAAQELFKFLDSIKK